MFLELSPLPAFIDWLQRMAFTTDRLQHSSDLPVASSALSTDFPLKGKVLRLLAIFKSHKIRLIYFPQRNVYFFLHMGSWFWFTMKISDSAILLSHSPLMTLRHVPLTSAENMHIALQPLAPHPSQLTNRDPTYPSHIPMEISTLLSVCMSIITIGIQKSIITSLILHLFIYSLIQQRLILQTPFTTWLGKLVPQRLKVNEVKLNQKWEMEGREGGKKRTRIPTSEWPTNPRL